jgi:hypothetical protein
LWDPELIVLHDKPAVCLAHVIQIIDLLRLAVIPHLFLLLLFRFLDCFPSFFSPQAPSPLDGEDRPGISIPFSFVIGIYILPLLILVLFEEDEIAEDRDWYDAEETGVCFSSSLLKDSACILLPFSALL